MALTIGLFTLAAVMLGRLITRSKMIKTSNFLTALLSGF